MRTRSLRFSRLALAVGLVFANRMAVGAETNVATEDEGQPLPDVRGAVLPSINVTGVRSRDEAGKDRVYTREIANVYIGRKEMDDYRGTSVADVFKGLNGVYAGDARNSGAIDANIRGIQGQGRVPVTVDGTEQTVSIFLGPMGVAGRSYIDPNILGGITVEKGPSLTRGVKSGVGGAVIATTLEADDILRPGRRWGVDLKTDTGNNSVSPHVDDIKWLGVDYRDIPGAYFEGQTVRLPEGAYDYAPPHNRKSSWGGFDGERRSARLAAAFKNDWLEGVAAYSIRKRGNYFAGKGGSEDYLFADWGSAIKATGGYQGNDLPYLANIYRPGKEVSNTSSDLRSVLLKTTLKLPVGQTLKLGYLNTRHTFGETIPWYAEFVMLNYRPDTDLGPFAEYVFHMPLSEIENDTYNLRYSWRPEGSRWLDLQAGLWRTRHHSERHQNGGMPWGVAGEVPEIIWWGAKGDTAWDTWTRCFPRRADVYPGGEANLYWEQDCGALSADRPPEKLPDPEGKFRIVPTALMIDTDTRWGVNLSNRFRLRPNLDLTLSGDMQHEKLRGRQDKRVEVTEFNLGSHYLGPRSGTRQEYRASLRLDWRPSERLSLSAGLAYKRYWSLDDKTTEQRRRRNESWKILPKNTHSYMHYMMMGSAEDARMGAVVDGYRKRMAALVGSGPWTPEKGRKTAAEQAAFDYLARRGNAMAAQGVYGQRVSNVLSGYRKKPYKNADGRYENAPGLIGITDARNGNRLYYWGVTALMPRAPGKDYPAIKDNPFHNGQIDMTEKVADPQGVKGEYLRYLPGHGGGIWDESRAARYAEYLSRLLTPREAQTEGFTRSLLGFGSSVKDDITPIPDPWAAPKKRRDDAWAPMFAATYALTDFIRVYGRYSEAVRFPSLYESGRTVTGWGSVLENSLSRPERARNWEFGYLHDLTGWLPRLRLADLKFNYYHNTIRNYIDHSSGYQILQFDKKLSTGLELQARADSGRYFADLGVTWRLKQQLCDAGYAAAHDAYYGRKYDTCVTAGFPLTQAYMSLQPKYSVNLSGGLRLFDGRLELGGRMVHHGAAENEDAEKWLHEHNNLSGSAGFMTPFEWHPIWVFDAYANYRFNDYASLNFGIENIGNRYYADPLARIPQPAPGRTLQLGLNVRF